MFESMNISGSGLTAAKKWMEVTSNNIVNANTTSANGVPYKRQAVIFDEIPNTDNFGKLLSNKIKNSGSGVAISEIRKDDNINLVYDPTHPHANAQGYVAYPAVELVAEMTNVMVGQRMYEANTNVLNSNKAIMDKTLEIGRN
jgi:flagellar basal-body rod protein FlgC